MFKHAFPCLLLSVYVFLCMHVNLYLFFSPLVPLFTIAATVQLMDHWNVAAVADFCDGPLDCD